MIRSSSIGGLFDLTGAVDQSYLLVGRPVWLNTDGTGFSLLLIICLCHTLSEGHP